MALINVSDPCILRDPEMLYVNFGVKAAPVQFMFLHSAFETFTVTILLVFVKEFASK
jgi:hypothetical protein